MNTVFALLSGLVFGLGLIVSGMTDPSKVIGFLDVAGRWDPSLAMVMGGAIAVGLLAFRIAAGRSHALLGRPLSMPLSAHIDRRLVLGSACFGVGWGLGGFCPGPGLVSLSVIPQQALVFVGAMLAGMAIFALLDRRP